LKYYNNNIKYGICCKEIIPKNQDLMIYYGEIITSIEAKKRYVDYDINNLNYILTIKELIIDKDKGDILLCTNIDATKFGSIARFVNHSCQPNLNVKMIRQKVCFYVFIYLIYYYYI
jgi:SET domain-containing protein